MVSVWKQAYSKTISGADQTVKKSCPHKNLQSNYVQCYNGFLFWNIKKQAYRIFSLISTLFPHISNLFTHQRILHFAPSQYLLNHPSDRLNYFSTKCWQVFPLYYSIFTANIMLCETQLCIPYIIYSRDDNFSCVCSAENLYPDL